VVEDVVTSAAPRVVIAAAVVAPAIEALAVELRRNALTVEVATADVLRDPPGAATYLFAFDAAIGTALAPRIVAWADAHEPRPGLIGVVDDGGGAEREALLAAGFDDVVAGPVSAREISARVRAVHRRVHWTGPSIGRLRYGAFTLDVDTHALWIDDAAIELTSAELAVVRELIKARGKPLSRAALLDAAWGGAELEVSERAVDNVILRLRRKLPRPDLVETVRSIGFRIATEV
jgi:DNA-binding response OmpR family regulator